MRKKCRYYPCHEDMDDCTFCYCPIYPCKNETLGKWVWRITPNINSKKKKIWDCSSCNLVHKKEFVKLVKKIARKK